MTELEKKIRKVFERPQTAALATISASGAPWVRYVTVRAEPDLTLNFCTGLSTRKAAEIAANPNIHLTCGELRPPTIPSSSRSPAAPRFAATRRSRPAAGRRNGGATSRGPMIPNTSWYSSILPASSSTVPVSFEPQVWEK